MKHLLVANRGEIALRILRTARALGLRTTAVYSEADADSPHVAAADHAVPIGPAKVSESYLRIDRIVDAARSAGADAVHPGYGLLSENAAFAKACVEAGLVFVGPDPEAIELMADKRAARAAAEAASVPCVPGFDGAGADLEAFVVAAGEIGYPVLVKAAAGGGGRGMRRADSEAALREAWALAGKEAEAAFGDPRLLLEKLVERGRHVELQVLADRHGGAVHLGERDCSVQRRFQKVLEESPSPAVDEALRARMGEAALRLVRAASYVGAGTVEFLLDADGEHFYFLEMNTRLQVEHPVTELVTGLDLVALQLRVADGERLPLSQPDVRLRGHAIEARLYAEDPGADFLPQTGAIGLLSLPTGEGVRVDHALREGLSIGAHYDPMLAKVIAHGETRQDALRRLDRALGETTLLGLTHNRDFLRRVLGSEAFSRGQVDTGWLGRDGGALLAAPAPARYLWALAALTLLHLDAHGRDHGELFGRQNARPVSFPFELSHGAETRLLRLRRAGDGWDAMDGEQVAALRNVVFDPGTWTLEACCDGVRRRARAQLVGDTVQLDDGTRYDFADHTRAPAGSDGGVGSGRIVAALEGRVVHCHVTAGQTVARGDVLLVVEAMKLQNNVLADVDGVVAELAVTTDDQVAIGQLLVEITPT